MRPQFKHQNRKLRARQRHQSGIGLRRPASNRRVVSPLVMTSPHARTSTTPRKNARAHNCRAALRTRAPARQHARGALTRRGHLRNCLADISVVTARARAGRVEAQGVLPFAHQGRLRADQRHRRAVDLDLLVGAHHQLEGVLRRHEVDERLLLVWQDLHAFKVAISTDLVAQHLVPADNATPVAR